MAYVTPTNRSTGDLITAAIWNADVVENVKQTAVGIVMTAGDIVYATGANALTRLAASANKYPRWNAAGTALTASGRVVGSNTAEQTMTAAAAADLVTISGLSIPVTSNVRITGVARTAASAGTFQPSLGVKVNSTVVIEADGTAASLWLPGAATEAQDGYFVIEFGPRSANYLNGVHVLRVAYGATAGYTTPRTAVLTAALPNATITSIAIRGLSDGTRTLGVKEVFVEQID